VESKTIGRTYSETTIVMHSGSIGRSGSENRVILFGQTESWDENSLTFHQYIVKSHYSRIEEAINNHIALTIVVSHGDDIR